MKKQTYISAFLLLALMLISAASYAEMYQWTDKNGNLMISDDPSKVPEEFRQRQPIQEKIAGNSTEFKSSDLIQTFSLSELPEQISGCSCFFYANDKSKQQMVFASNKGNNVCMKIEGKLVRLTLKESKFRDVGSIMPKKIGGKLKFVYSAGDIVINIDLEATSVCASGSECEGQSYNGVFTAVKGNLKQTVEAKGSCGC